MTRIVATPLNQESFEPFGRVIAAPIQPGRLDFSDDLENSRPQAKLSLSTIRILPLPLPLRVTMMERHEASSQSFIPLTASRYLVIVAPGSPAGGPDGSQVCAFVAHSGQGITYRMGVWHHAMTALEEPAEFAIVMWRDGTGRDEEWITLSEPFTVIESDCFSN